MENKNLNADNEVRISYEGITITAIIEMADKQETRTVGLSRTWQVRIKDSDKIVLTFDEKGYKTFIEIFKDVDLDTTLEDIVNTKNK